MCADRISPASDLRAIWNENGAAAVVRVKVDAEVNDLQVGGVQLWQGVQQIAISNNVSQAYLGFSCTGNLTYPVSYTHLTLPTIYSV